MRAHAEVSEERAVLDAALDGDPEAMRRLVTMLRPVVQAEVAWTLTQRAPHGRGRDPQQEVQDLVQEVFVALLERDHRRLRSWDPERGRSLKSFVRLLARHRVVAVLRSRPRSPWTEEPAAANDLPTPAEPGHGDRVAARVAVQQVLGHVSTTMPARSAQIFEALYLEEASVEEVCRTHDLSRDAVYSWRLRFKRSLQRIRLGWDSE